MRPIGISRYRVRQLLDGEYKPLMLILMIYETIALTILVIVEIVK